METIKIKDVTSHLEGFAPPAYQESYDNSGLLTGDREWLVTGILITLDCIESVVDEAIALKCNLIVAHHPIIFKGLKKITGTNYVERTIIKAIKNDIAIYAIHTNLDNVINGVNQKIAEKIGLVDIEVLSAKDDQMGKLVTFIPQKDVTHVMDALHQAGAGNIGKYEHCSFQILGKGTFRPGADANPHIGKPGHQEMVDEIRTEVIFPAHRKSQILKALKDSHPYEEVAYYVSHLDNTNNEVGAGIIGKLPQPMEPLAFLRRLKDVMNTACIRYTEPPKTPIEKVAVCGGSGSFLLPMAKAKGASAYVSADFKYHEFFDADGQILVADIGHYESEQFTKDLLKEVLDKKFPNFALYFSKTVTNPISYL
ncbi:MAG TPA: Nif3-like dinuclear metal center hexameric protein [Cyclobacteriaceae bacterium]|nr:Nif3-like dinuclear metal center hexameric protein [Cyclobacteriaceae bacterium]